MIEREMLPHLLKLARQFKAVVGTGPRQSGGRFIITGSQHLGLPESVNPSLAGRVALLELLPYSKQEIAHGGYAPDTLDLALFTGAYPRYTIRNRTRSSGTTAILPPTSSAVSAPSSTSATSSFSNSS
ncbi:MAG: hypothetical protein WC789_05185 [Lentisphaeria bacterium]|jgi:hypothetical protein